MARKTSNHKIILSAEDRTKLAVSQAEAHMRKLKKEVASTERSLKAAFDPRIIAGFVGAIGVAAVAREVTQLGTAYTKINEKISLGNKTIDKASASESKLTEVRTKLLQVSNDTFSQINSNSTAYSKLAFATERLGKDSNETIGILEKVNKTLEISAATTQEAIAARLQFSQALASDRLGGDEYRSLTENAPRLIKAIADGLDVSIGKLKELSKDGKLTADVVLGALATQTAAIDEEFSTLSLTIDRAQTIWSNNLTEYLGKLNEGIGLNVLLADSIKLASENIDVMAGSLGILAAIFAGRLAGSLSKYITLQVLLTTATERQAFANKTAMASELATAKARQAHAAMLFREAEASVAATVGLARLTKVTTTLIPAQNALTASTRAVALAQGQYAVASKSASVAAGIGALAARGLSGALSLVGGPVGAAVLAGVGVLYYGNKLLEQADSLNVAKKQEKEHQEDLKKTRKLTDEITRATERRIKVIGESLEAQLAEAEALERKLNADAAHEALNLKKNPLKVVPGQLTTDIDGLARVNKAKTAERLAKKQREYADTLRKQVEASRISIAKRNEELKTSNILTREGTQGELEAAKAYRKSLELEEKNNKELSKKASLIEASLFPQIAQNKREELYKELLDKKIWSEEKYNEVLKKSRESLLKSTKTTKTKLDQDKESAKAMLSAADPAYAYALELERINHLKEKGLLVGKYYETVLAKAKKDHEEATKKLNKEQTQANEESKRHQEQLKDEAKELNRLHDPLQEYNDRKAKLNELNKTGVLDQKAFNEELAKAKKIYEESNKFLAEKNRLLAERDLIGANPLDTYRKELEKTGDYKPKEIDSLVNDAQLSAFKKVKEEIIQQGIESGLTEKQYIRMRLSLEGLSAKQVEYSATLIEANKRTSEARQANARFAESFEQDIESALESGTLSFKNFGDAFIAEIKRMYIYKPLLDSLFGAKTNDGGRAGGVLGDVVSSLFKFANGGIMSANGSLPLQAYSMGGIANRPQLALFGEGRMNEAYVPLPDGKTIPVTLKAADSSRGLNITVNHSPSIHVEADADKEYVNNALRVSHAEFKKEVPQIIEKSIRRGESTAVAVGRRLG